MLGYLSKDKDLKNGGIIFGEETEKTFTESHFCFVRSPCKV